MPTSREAAALADWAELVVLSADSGVSITRLGRLLRGDATDQAEEEFELDEVDEPDGEGAELELSLVDEGRGEREAHIERMVEEITLRRKLGPKLYPFEADDDRVNRLAAPGEYVYLFLLVLSWKEAPAREAEKLHQVEATYDMIALEAMRRYLGRQAQGIRFARNAHDPEDNATRPKLFSEAIAWLRGKLSLAAAHGGQPPNEERVKHWEDDENARTEDGRPILNSYSDGGVDVVVWWRFADGRLGSPVLLAQCTVQLTWEDKVSDVKIELWQKWIDFATVPPQKALVIPFAVPRTARTWLDRTTSAGVIIDRTRLLELLNELEPEELEALVQGSDRGWVDEQLTALA